MKKLTDLLLMPIVTESGRRLGLVFDIRSAGAAEDFLEPHPNRQLTELVYGRLGFLARIGVRHSEASTLPWASVIELRKNAIVVSDDAEERGTPPGSRRKRRES